MAHRVGADRHSHRNQLAEFVAGQQSISAARCRPSLIEIPDRRGPELLVHVPKKRFPPLRIDAGKLLHRAPPESAPLRARSEFSAKVYPFKGNFEQTTGSADDRKKQLLVPQHDPLFSSRRARHKEQALHPLFLQHGQHVSQAIQKAIVAGEQNSPWRRLKIALFPCQNFFR